jgi:hypothetical protein
MCARVFDVNFQAFVRHVPGTDSEKNIRKPAGRHESSHAEMEWNAEKFV